MFSKVVKLPDRLIAIRDKWNLAELQKRDEIFASEFFPEFSRLFAKLRLDGDRVGLQKPQGLISVLGLSWQPVALMARWASPKQMLVIGTYESLEKTVANRSVKSLLIELSDIPIDRIDFRQIPDDGELQIYHEVKSFFQRHRLEPKKVLIDPTGGKKTMSMAAALAGFVLGVPLVYVDYEKYDYEKRIPVAGTEYPRLIANPLEELGDLQVDRIKNAFNDGAYLLAESLADDLAVKLYEPREPEALGLVIKGYGAWDSFKFTESLGYLEKLQGLLNRYTKRGKWSWAASVVSGLEKHLPILETLSKIKSKPDRIDQGMPLVLNHLASSIRHLSWGKLASAVMLLYATIERFVDLCLWVDYGLDDEKPNYELIRDNFHHQVYHSIGKMMFGKNYEKRDLHGKLHYTNGIQLLATLNPTRIRQNELRPLLGLSSNRNKCEYEHGFLPKPPRKEDVTNNLKVVKEIIAREIGGPDAVRDELTKYEFPRL